MYAQTRFVLENEIPKIYWNFIQIESCYVIDFFLKVDGILWFDKRIRDFLSLGMFRERGDNLLRMGWILLIVFFL